MLFKMWAMGANFFATRASFRHVFIVTRPADDLHVELEDILVAHLLLAHHAYKTFIVPFLPHRFILLHPFKEHNYHFSN